MTGIGIGSGMTLVVYGFDKIDGLVSPNGCPSARTGGTAKNIVTMKKIEKVVDRWQGKRAQRGHRLTRDISTNAKLALRSGVQ